MKRYLTVLAVVAGLVPVAAQTTTSKLAWDQPLLAGQTLADVQAAVWTLKIDTAAPTIVVATCVAGTPIVCTTPLGPFATGGQHTLTITGTNAYASVSASLTGGPLAVPANMKVVITVTVP